MIVSPFVDVLWNFSVIYPWDYLHRSSSFWESIFIIHVGVPRATNKPSWVLAHGIQARLKFTEVRGCPNKKFWVRIWLSKFLEEFELGSKKFEYNLNFYVDLEFYITKPIKIFIFLFRFILLSFNYINN